MFIILAPAGTKKNVHTGPYLSSCMNVFFVPTGGDFSIASARSCGYWNLTPSAQSTLRARPAEGR